VAIDAAQNSDYPDDQTRGVGHLVISTNQKMVRRRTSPTVQKNCPRPTLSKRDFEKVSPRSPK
jgi:hypothetical protein